MIEAREITKFYGKGESRFQVLKNISIKINDGDFTVILGASGSGKSTLLNTLSSLERPDSGSIFYNERDITTLSESELTKLRRDNIGFIFQQYYLLPNMNVDKNVKMGADLSGKTSAEAAFSRSLSSFRVPGIGTIYGFLQSIHAREICAGVAFFSESSSRVPCSRAEEKYSFGISAISLGNSA